MSKEETVLRFEEVSFEYGPTHPILNEVDFSLRKGMKVALMGQNGAGKEYYFPAYHEWFETGLRARLTQETALLSPPPNKSFHETKWT